MEITRLNQLDLRKSYTYADYLTWKISERVELLKGKIFQMSPAPARIHQKISQNINFILLKNLELKKCEVYTAPFDVRLSSKKTDKEIINVVQPDLCVVCDLSKLDDKGCLGAPNLIVEILSPGNSIKELKFKFDLYQSAGVQEYWIVQPTDQTVLQYVLEKGEYINHRPLTIEDCIDSASIKGLNISLANIFAN